MKRISVIMPVLRGGQDLEACVSSVLAQTFADFELILVCHGTEGSGARLSGFFESDDSRVRVVNGGSCGVVEARYCGLMYSDGEWVCFADPAGEMHPLTLERLYGMAWDETDIVYGSGKALGIGKVGKLSNSTFRHIVVQTDNAVGHSCGSLFRRRILSRDFFAMPQMPPVATDYIFWLYAAFSTSKDVAVVYDNLYVVGSPLVSSAFTLTPEYFYELNQYRKKAIPAQLAAEYASATIADRLSNLFRLAMTTRKKELKNSAFYLELCEDMRRRGMRLPLKQRLIVELPSRRLRRYYAAVTNAIVSLKDIVD